MSFKKNIEKITIKKGDEKVRVIAVANSRFITEINIKMFIAKNPNPLKKLSVMKILLRFLKIVKYSFVNKINKIKGITPAIFLNTANWITEYSFPRNFITTIYKSTHRIAINIVVTAR